MVAEESCRLLELERYRAIVRAMDVEEICRGFLERHKNYTLDADVKTLRRVLVPLRADFAPDATCRTFEDHLKVVAVQQVNLLRGKPVQLGGFEMHDGKKLLDLLAKSDYFSEHPEVLFSKETPKLAETCFPPDQRSSAGFAASAAKNVLALQTPPGTNEGPLFRPPNQRSSAQTFGGDIGAALGPSSYVRRPFQMPRLPTVDATFYGTVTLVDDDNFIHVRCNILQDRFQKCSPIWQSAFEAAPPLDPLLLRFGSPCVVKYAVDNQWYRATYCGIRQGERKFFYEDFGSMGTVAGTDIRGLDSKHIIGYEIPSSVYSCKLVNPANHDEYAVLSPGDQNILRRILADGQVEIDVNGYECVYLHYSQRIILCIDAWTLEEKCVVDVLLESNSQLKFEKFFKTPITFDTEPFLRSCQCLQFPYPHASPKNEQIYLRVQSLTGTTVTVSYTSVDQAKWENASAGTKLIYGDADILASMETNWTKSRNQLVPARLILVDNTYLVNYRGICCRAEVTQLLDVDEYLTPVKVEVLLVDRGITLDVACKDIFELPAVVPVHVPKQAFDATVMFDFGVADKLAVRPKARKTKKICGVPRVLSSLQGAQSVGIPEEPAGAECELVESLDDVAASVGLTLVAVFADASDETTLQVKFFRRACEEINWF